MYIDHHMAQKIVDRAMKITGCNVNVMDHQGVIIGSGDPARVDQLHEGALNVLSSHGEVDIEREQESQLRGVRGGVNLPIYNQGEIVGVVGITGEPEEVRKFADLVVMTAELVVEQAALTVEVQWDRRQRESVVMRLIEGGPRDSLFEDRVARLGLDLDQPRVAVVLEFGVSAGELSLAQLQQRLSQLQSGQDGALGAILSPRQMVLLWPVRLSEDGWERSRLQRQLDRDCQSVDGLQRLAVGDYFSTPDGLSRSYQVALRTLEVAALRSPGLRYCEAGEFALDLLLFEARNSWAGKRLVEVFERLRAQDRQGGLEKTLNTYLEEQLDFGRTTERLHIHRNTLRYRLDKISSALALDLGRPDDLLQLVVAQRLDGLRRRDR
ncbi:MAG: helix-turn-helix domain-containing protein [Oceanospirillaceae bacterium]|nr:helix-turn-helix domain-containing protein [Oceanospirillaceae bacterium]